MINVNATFERRTMIPSMSLRYIERDGKRILQQLFTVAESGRPEWFYVPFAGTVEGTNEAQTGNV